VARIKRDPSSQPIAEAVLDAAMKVFGKNGFEASSMKAIAAEAGLTAAGIYYHYENKNDLLYQSLLYIVQSVFTACDEAIADIEDPGEALRTFVSTYLVYQHTQLRNIAPFYGGLVHGSTKNLEHLGDKQLKHILGLEHELLNRLRGILSKGNRTKMFEIASITQTSFAIFGMCEHTLIWFRAANKRSLSRLASHYSDLAMRMVGAQYS